MCFVEFGGITIIGWQRERISCGPLYCCVQENSFDALKINYSLVQKPNILNILLLMPPPPTKKIRRGNECHNVCVATAGGTGGRRTSMPQKMLLDLHFILRLYLDQINVQKFTTDHSNDEVILWVAPPNFSTKIKIITQAKQNKWFPTYLLLLRDAKNVEECEESERCFQNSPGLWASCDDHLLPPGQDMTCDDYVIMRHHDDGDPETDDRKCQYIVHISTPLLHLPHYPSFSFHTSQYWQIKGQYLGHVVCLN